LIVGNRDLFLINNVQKKRREMFEKLKGVVLNFLGIEKFSYDEKGKVVLSDDERTRLAGAFGDDFVDKWEAALDKELANNEAVEKATAAVKAVKDENEKKMREMAEAHKAEVEKLKSERMAVEKEKEALKNTVKILSDVAEEVKPAEVITKPDAIVSEPWHGKKANRKYFHNQMAFDKLNGDSSKAILAKNSGSFNFGNIKMGDTIDSTELATEFGEYMSQFNIQLEVIKLLTQPTESQKYMTTKMAITTWKASKAVISSVVQQFVAKWTPLGSSTFTPIEITNRRHKVNLPITPDDITDGWLSYLYNEQVTPDQMPITRYIVEQLLRPKIDSDIELLLIATGEYEALGTVTEGDAGQATGKSMDGYITVLEDLKGTVGNAANWYAATDDVFGTGITTVTASNVLDVIEDFAKWVKKTAPLYHSKGLNLFIDPEVEEMFQFAYRDAFPVTKNEDGRRAGPDFSKLTFVPLEAMRGTGVFFTTPKENFIRLIHENEAGGATRLFFQVENYDVKVFAEFWLGVGFALEELIFAWIPEETSGSGSAS
jgi:hypothetical protein